MNEVQSKLQELDGTLLDRLYVIFDDKLIKKEAMKLSKDKMSFKAEFDKGSLAMMILDIKRS
jgi:hypothetical protein